MDGSIITLHYKVKDTPKLVSLATNTPVEVPLMIYGGYRWTLADLQCPNDQLKSMSSTALLSMHWASLIYSFQSQLTKQYYRQVLVLISMAQVN